MSQPALILVIEPDERRGHVHEDPDAGEQTRLDRRDYGPLGRRHEEARYGDPSRHESRRQGPFQGEPREGREQGKGSVSV